MLFSIILLPFIPESAATILKFYQDIGDALERIDRLCTKLKISDFSEFVTLFHSIPIVPSSSNLNSSSPSIQNSTSTSTKLPSIPNKSTPSVQNTVKKSFNYPKQKIDLDTASHSYTSNFYLFLKQNHPKIAIKFEKFYHERTAQNTDVKLKYSELKKFLNPLPQFPDKGAELGSPLSSGN